MRNTRRALALVGWCGLLAVAIVVASGIGPPAAGLLASSTWPGGATGPVLATFAVLRLVLLWLGWYLAGITVLHAVAVTWRSHALARLAEAVTIPAARGFLATTLGLGLVASTGPPADPSSAGGATAVAAPAPAELARRDVSPPSMVPLPTSGQAPRMQPLPTTQDPATDHGTWTVRRGDHLWGIAARVLADAHGHPVDDQAVVPYWRRLVEANRDRLVDAGNPDLILPRQVLVLPPFEAAP